MRILKIALAVIVLTAIVLAALVWTLPADVAYRNANRLLGPVVLSGLRGTVWDGHADGISVFGRDLGELDWHARKLAAVQGHFVSDVRIKGAGVEVAGVVTRSADAVAVSDFRFSFPASLLAPTLQIEGLELSGTINGVVSQATLVGVLLHGVVGTASWSHAAISGIAELQFADIVAEFASQASGDVAGSLHDAGGGPLAVDGTFNARFGMFDARFNLRARDGNPRLTDALGRLGQLQSDSSVTIEIHDRVAGMP